MNITAGKAERQLVIFNVNSEAFGVDIGNVREIIRLLQTTKVPGVPNFVKGVINLRGKVIPVVDLRKKFGFPPVEQADENRILVMAIDEQDIGVIVDSVAEVLRVPVDSVVPPSSLMSNTDSEYLLGIAKLEKKLVILLDMNKILTRLESISLATSLSSMKQNINASDRAAAKKPVKV